MKKTSTKLKPAEYEPLCAQLAKKASAGRSTVIAAMSIK